MKRCLRCGQIKPLDHFSPRHDRPAGVLSHCRECLAAKSRDYYAANKAKKAAYYQANKDRIAAKYAEVRRAAIAIYGGRCAECGSTGALQLDHVDGGGNAHRRTEAHQALYRRIARTGRPVEDHRLQALCEPCHGAKTSRETSQTAGRTAGACTRAPALPSALWPLGAVRWPQAGLAGLGHLGRRAGDRRQRG